MSGQGALRPGDVLLLFDAMVRPPKYKRFLCVVAADGWFLRINSRPYFRPHLAMPARDNPDCLDHDSFVELRGIIEHDLAEIAEALNRADARILGRLSLTTARSLMAAIRAAPTLTEAEAGRILAALGTTYGIVG